MCSVFLVEYGMALIYRKDLNEILEKKKNINLIIKKYNNDENEDKVFYYLQITKKLEKACKNVLE